jgi:hypothetical protein
MAELVRSGYDLPTLRVQLERTTREQAQVVVDFVWHDNVDPVMTVHPDALGVPDTITSARDLPESRFLLPPGLAAAIAEIVPPSADAPCLWLQLPFPRGYLHLVPWERLLSPVVGRPLRRLPNFTLRPQAPGNNLRVLLCASQPRAKSRFSAGELVVQAAQCWRGALEDRVAIHVFGDVSVAKKAGHTLAQHPHVTVHNPNEAAAFPLPRRTRGLEETADEVTNPWLLWMESATQGVAADIVHFVGHGYLSGDEGALALASSPVVNTDTRWARFIGVTQLCEFMCRVGAWSLALTGAPNNFSIAGLRGLADGIALARPGVALVHDAGVDPDLDELKAGLRMIYVDDMPDAPMSSLTSWSHPASVEYPNEPYSMLLGADGASTLLSEATQQVLAREETPAWVAAGARALETLQADWFPDAHAPEDPEAVAALERISAIFDQHIQTHVAGIGEGTVEA